MTLQEVLTDWLWDENETTPASVQAQGILEALAVEGFAVIHVHELGTAIGNVHVLRRKAELR